VRPQLILASRRRSAFARSCTLNETCGHRHTALRTARPGELRPVRTSWVRTNNHAFGIATRWHRAWAPGGLTCELWALTV